MLTPSGPTITPKRPTQVFGEPDWVDLTPIPNAVVVSPQLFVPRGCDLKIADKFAHQEKTYFVLDGPKWDTDGYSGESLGYVEFEIATEVARNAS